MQSAPLRREGGVDQAINWAREEAEKAAAARDPGWGKLMLKLANLQYTRFEKGIEEGRRSSISAGGGLTGDLDLEHAMNAWRKVAAGPSGGRRLRLNLDRKRTYSPRR
jgi:hypothetical protein